MNFFGNGLSKAWHLITHLNPYLVDLTWNSLKVAFIPTAIAAVIGLPLGVIIGIGRFRGRGGALALANIGFGLPPVLVGLVVTVLSFPLAPLGKLHLLFTLKGVYVAQTLLSFPLIVALTAASVRALPPGLLDQARAFGASRTQVAALALREARIGVLAALIASIGSGLSEVGAVALVGGNIYGYTQTLATATLERVSAGDFPTALAIGIILMGLVVLLTAMLTLLQYRSGVRARVRAS